jgi:hypothetical protein
MKPDSVPAGADFFRALAAWFRERLFMHLACYADETGTHDAGGVLPGAEVAAVGGYIGWKDTWDVFCQEWQAVLDEYGIRLFHTSEFRAPEQRTVPPNHPYYGWPNDKRVRFIKALVRVARQNTLLGIVAGVSVRDYEVAVPAKLKEEIGHPYYFCFQLFFENVLKAITNDTRINMGSPPERVAMFFDRQDQFKTLAIKMYDELLAKDTTGRMGGIAFEDKALYLPLQAADLLAYCYRRQLARHMKLHSAPVEPGWETALQELASSQQNIRLGFYDAGSLSTLVSTIKTARPGRYE